MHSSGVESALMYPPQRLVLNLTCINQCAYLHISQSLCIPGLLRSQHPYTPLLSLANDSVSYAHVLPWCPNMQHLINKAKLTKCEYSNTVICCYKPAIIVIKKTLLKSLFAMLAHLITGLHIHNYRQANGSLDQKV